MSFWKIVDADQKILKELLQHFVDGWFFIYTLVCKCYLYLTKSKKKTVKNKKEKMLFKIYSSFFRKISEAIL